LSLLFHTRGETREVYDAKSDLGIYRVDSNTVVFPPAIAAPDRNESWPSWAPDGRYLYFSSATPQPVEKLRLLRYDLMRASFDIQTGQWGQPELMISAAETGLSACQPKISPDGRFLLVTMCSNGGFPIFRPDSDLYAMDLATRGLRRLEINSDQADTWHSWSGNSRWVVFSSKRLDGLLARPHFSYVDEHGEFHKPFVLPQEDPSFYAFCLNTFNVPELMQGPVTVTKRDLARAAVEPRKVLTPQVPAGDSSPGSQPGQDESGYPYVRK
jgi:dipeptidyl aminopeptidase/acylaminoacyl peptidase